MTLQPPTELSPHTVHEDADPLCTSRMLYREIFYPLGFAVEIETNSLDILSAAQESWAEQWPIVRLDKLDAPLTLRLGLSSSASRECPPEPKVRAHSHLLSIVADGENYATCDLERGLGFGWINDACLQHRSYFRYFFLEAMVMCLLTGSRVTPIHAACVSFNGHGILLCGESGAGKSTLAYACAREGFTFTSDDASYIAWQHAGPARVRANCHQLRFRPSSIDFFPELHGRSITPRAAGKPSIEVRTSELPNLITSPEALVQSIVMLQRRAFDAPHGSAEIHPLHRDHVVPHLERCLFNLGSLRERQATSLQPLLDAAMYELRYRDLSHAVSRLKQLATNSPR